MFETLKNLKIRICLVFSFMCLDFSTKRRRGSFLPVVMMSSVLFLAFATAIITLSMSNVKIANLHNKKITSMSIAEAGINYYLWHLAHNNTDYCDGQVCDTNETHGPYNHSYTDASGRVLGTYDLYITPPSPGNSLITVKSIGKVNGVSPRRTIVATIGMPSFTKYTLLTNNRELWIGDREKIDGSVFVNHSGVRNDGEATGDVSSSESTYTSQMFGGNHPGIWGSGKFGGAKLFPVPPIDFNQLNVDFLNIRNESKLSPLDSYYDASGPGNVGYHITLKNDNYEITTVKKFDNTGLFILKEDAPVTHSYPATGIIYCEDDVWIEGTINNKKITVIAADPEASGGQKKRMVISNPIKYTSYDGSDKIGLLTQTNILLNQNAPDNMEIDAAMIAKDGSIKINQYNQVKNNIKVYGSMAHNNGLIWSYSYSGSSVVISGYKTTETIMDRHNVLNPPPKFPLTGTYAILSWREE